MYSSLYLSASTSFLPPATSVAWKALVNTGTHLSGKKICIKFNIIALKCIKYTNFKHK